VSVCLGGELSVADYMVKPSYSVLTLRFLPVKSSRNPTTDVKVESNINGSSAVWEKARM